MKTSRISAALMGLFICCLSSTHANSPALLSIDTGYTITKVQTGQSQDGSFIVASSYEGTVLILNFKGEVLGQNTLSGFMNHDLWCADLDGDQVDEILAANANGTLYCLNSAGQLLWECAVSETPLYSTCVVRKAGVPYVVCGGFDTSIHYLTAAGQKIKSIASKTYSEEKPWNWVERNPAGKDHSINFVRPVKQKDGSEVLVVIGHIAQTSGGSAYQFRPLEDMPFNTTKLKTGRVIGSFNTSDLDNDGDEELLIGTSGSLDQSFILQVALERNQQAMTALSKLGKKVDSFGYRVAQPAIIEEGGEALLYTLFGSRTVLLRPGADPRDAEVLKCRYSFNDMWKDASSPYVILASAQSGGSCVHLIDTSHPDWKQAYENLTPPGKIQTILDGTAQVRAQLEPFEKPSYERAALPVYLMSDRASTPHSEAVVKDIVANHNSPVFLGGQHQSKVEGFDRSSMNNEPYEKRRDKRKKYVLSQQEALDALIPLYKDTPGIAYWGGHGNDPNYYQVSTTKKVIDAAQGKKTVLIYPEIQDHTENFQWLMDYLIHPLAEHAQGRNANLYIRSKNNFWHSDVYLEPWSRLVSGEFAEVFVPALEESHSKIQDMSVASRLGIWTSGSVDSWGARCARDNTSYDRSREHSHQMLPNHFLRHMIYNVASGAQYLDNFPVDQDYMSLLWELIAKGALYVPKREELVSLNPVFLGMKTPDEHFMDEGANVHWTVFYDEAAEAKNRMVFSRMNGSWKGAPILDWDFSRYAAAVKDRRLNLLPPYPNGVVMIAPPQGGVFADSNAPRGQMTDHLHPIYRSMMQEYITDGRNYLSADGQQTFAADTYYKQVEADIQAAAKKLPLTVSGDVAWVCAQTSPTHLRLTLVDSGYINPSAKTAMVTFHTVKPKQITDLLSQEIIDLPVEELSTRARPRLSRELHTSGANSSEGVQIDIPCGLFRFIDIELEKPLQ